MTEANQPNERRIGGSTVGYAAMAIALYVLSAGPVVMMLAKGILPPSFEPAIERVYWPVIWLTENTAFGILMDKYIDLWI
jgi:hypothetical protein